MTTCTSSGSNDAGASLLEVMVATAIMAVACAGLLAAFSFGVSRNHSQGEVATRTADLSRDKIDQLLALDIADGSTNTTVYPPSPTGGTGLGGTMAANATVGSINPAAPVANYVDYLDAGGNLLAGATSGFYRRQWSIGMNSTARIKTITVLTTAASAGEGGGRAPSTTLVCMKTLLQ